jgi:hypothetical protein
MTDIDKILAERAKTHGDYTEHALCTQDIMFTLMSHRNWSRLTADQKETLHMIAHKMGRVVTGNPDVADHWDDMAGYAKLSGDRVRERLGAAEDTETQAMRAYTRGPRQAKAEYPAGHGYNPQMDV